VGFDISQSNPVLESRMRVAILALLMNGDSASFVYLRDKLEASDGNIAQHLRALEDAGYVRMEKSFIGRKPRTDYTITREGQKAKKDYVALLRRLVKAEDVCAGREVRGWRSKSAAPVWFIM